MNERVITVDGRAHQSTRAAVLVLMATLVAVMLIGCNKMDGSSTKPTRLSPPSWIIGTWGESTGNLTWTFSLDNAVHRGTTISATVNFKDVEKSTPGSVSESAKSSSVYELTLDVGSSTGVYRFERRGADEMDYTISGSGVDIGPIEMTRQ